MLCCGRIGLPGQTTGSLIVRPLEASERDTKTNHTEARIIVALIIVIILVQPEATLVAAGAPFSTNTRTQE